MTARYQPDLLLARSEVVEAPAARACDNHSFGFPTGIYAAMATLLFGFLAVMSIGFATPELVVPMAINFFFLTAFFAVPTIFVNAAPRELGPRALRWSTFIERGVETETGHTSGGEAATLTLMLPFLIFCWAIAVVTIAALV